MKTKFYVCPTCGNVIIKLVDGGPIPKCCGAEMQELDCNTIEGKSDYHLPVVKFQEPCSVNICIGEQPHPMTKEHHICFLYIETEKGGQIIHLCPNCQPSVTIDMNKCPKAIYSYCNLHGLWKLEMPECPEGKSCKK